MNFLNTNIHLFLLMDILHYILIVIIFTLIVINNLPGIRKYYYPWFYSNMKSLTKALKGYMKNNTLPKKIEKPESAKKGDLYSSFNFKQLKEIQKKLSWKYQIAIMNLNCNLNVGAIYRSGCLLGMNKYVIMGKKIYHPRSQVGLDYVPIEYLDTFNKIRDRYDPSTIEDFNIKVFEKYLMKNKLIPLIIEQGGINILNINFANKEKELEKDEKYLFIFGNETHGVPSNLLSLAKTKKWLILSIPQWGCAHSFNVSQAANIIMWKYYQDNIKLMIN